MHGDGQPAVFADLTGELLYSRGIEYPPITPQEAAIKMATIIAENDFTMFEYFMTDYYGHKKNAAALQEEVRKINSFLAALVPLLEQNCALLAVSDHGNAEDMTTADHTINPALFLFYSRQLQQYREPLAAVAKLTDVYDFILNYYGDRVF
jgi:phosphopentomutase